MYVYIYIYIEIDIYIYIYEMCIYIYIYIYIYMLCIYIYIYICRAPRVRGSSEESGARESRSGRRSRPRDMTETKVMLCYNITRI